MNIKIKKNIFYCYNILINNIDDLYPKILIKEINIYINYDKINRYLNILKFIYL